MSHSSPCFAKKRVIPRWCANHRCRPTLCRILVSESNQYFRIAIDPLIEFVIGLRGFVDVDVMADNTARSCTSIHNHVAKIFVVFLDRRLPASHGDPLFEKIGEGKLKDTPLCVTPGALNKRDGD